MDNKKMRELIESMNNTKGLMDTIDDTIDMSSVLSRPLRDALEMSFMVYAFRIIEADGTINKDEAKFLSEAFKQTLIESGRGSSLTPESAKEMINATGYSKDVPPIFMVLTMVDQALRNLGVELNVTSTVAQIFDHMGAFLVEIAGSSNTKAKNEHSKGMREIYKSI